VTLRVRTSKVARVSRGTRRLPLPLSLILVGGPSGVGKSRFAQALARRTGSTVAQVDDVQTALEALVPADRLPEYFVPAGTYLRTDSPEEINDAIEQIAHFFAPAVHAAISNRIESGTSTVFEGDFISPDVAAEARARGVRSLFLLGSETDIRSNYLERDGDDQVGRAQVSAVRSRRLADRCGQLGLLAMPARPFPNLASRAYRALGISPLRTRP
jgi:2-phosphoglycerate kinase